MALPSTIDQIPPRNVGPIGRRIILGKINILCHGIQDHKVVTQSMHFGELHILLR
ncbi:MAG: hypothetical protein FKGGLIKP_00776 [Sodalis sp. Fse]|nr:MAG: hypothetical protein FKGGLIKP_00776 [Sodalis sp. Fse]